MDFAAMTDQQLRLPAFNLPATPDQQITDQTLLGQYAILYFYPKDNTPGCSQQGQDFRDLYNEFQQLNCQIFGVSKDSLKQHQNFKEKYAFPFELISDPDEVLCQAFNVIKLKKNFGKEYMGIERSTFLLNETGQVVASWRKVRVPQHAQDVLTLLKRI
ncbi:peroxiredoxin [Thiomicrospira aerophila AL3]|uniref:thioredoxin-dependent peroxiredoxin n=1 Tax=Thiomicrospira aerophila AL3 TaxID=717772 RepID=W0DVB2_9GAMM|nr:peroxiredoxin [Thiomicrospira aerophila]AHF01193.1 peroxiredoxin [Thiomicrospira aerophila AL3]